MYDRRATPLRTNGVFLGAALLLAGCAIAPPRQDIAPMKPADAYAGDATFADQNSAWPSDSWWREYGDPQLTALIEEGLTGASDMRIAAARLGLADAMVDPARGALLPTLDASGKVDQERQSYNYLIDSSVVPKGWNDAGIVSFNLNWELDFWGKNRAALAAAEGDAKAAAAEAAAARLAVSTGIANVYARLAALYADRDAASDALRVRKQTVRLIRNRFKKSLENESALERVKSAEASVEARLAAIDEQIGLTRNQLAALLGKGPDRGLAVTRPAVEGGRYVGAPAQLPAELLGRRPDVVAAKLHVEAAAKRIDQAEAAFYPNINLAAVVGRQALGLNLLSSSDSTFGSVGPVISLPIFDGGRLAAGQRKAEAQYDIAVATYDRTLTEALHQVADVLVSQRQLDRRLADTQRSAKAAEKAWRIVSDRYNGGLATYLEVLSAEDVLIDARRATAALQTRAFALDISMVRALGGGFRNTENPS